MNKYFKNYILFGDVESHCLLCNETFQSSSQIEKHIRWENHRKHVKNQTCIPKFKQDSIYKLDKIYYCAVCNYCMHDMNTITNHINDESHKANKANPEKVDKPSIGQYEAGIIVLKNSKKISNSQWHGIIGKTCIVCSNDTNDIAKHVKSQDHIINLIQTSIKYKNGECYRKINQNLFQCFTCKDLFPEDVFNEHWTNKAHLNNISKPKIKTNDETQYASELEKLIFEARDILIETQKDFFDLDYVYKRVTCKTCHKTIELDLKEMLMHMKKYHMDLIIRENRNMNAIKSARDIKTVDLYVDHGKRRAELACFGRENFIKLSAGARKGYCHLCDVCLSPEIKVFQSHVNGAFHTAHLKFKSSEKVTYEKEYYKTVTINEFINNLNYCKQLAAFLINKEYIVNKLTFSFIRNIDYEPQKVLMKCYVCNIIFPPQMILEHCETKQHVDNVMSARVLDIADEFIREIQLQKFHCSFCNQVFPFVETLKKHLKSWQHKCNKNEKKARFCFELFHQINGYMPNVEQIALSSNVEATYMQLFIFTFDYT